MSQRHQFHLRWSNYGQNLANSFVRLFESESLSDVTLFCEGESYRAHRVVLAASSAHFQELFVQCSTAQNLVVILDGTLAANLRALLEFMYKGEVYIDDANLNTFLQTAKRLQVKGLSLSQNDLHSISNEVGDDRQPSLQGGVDGKHSGSYTSSSGSQSQETHLAQSGGGSHLIPPTQGSSSHHHSQHSSSSHHQGPLQAKNTNTTQSPPTSFSTPSPPRHTPPHPLPASTAIYGPGEEKPRKKNRIPSPRRSPNGTFGDGMDYTGLHHPIRPSAPLPSPSPNVNLRHSMDIDRERGGMVGPGGFGSYVPHYGSSVPVAVPSGVPPPVPLQQSHQQQQTIVITENPNLRKLRSASTENTMPEDLSIKLEVGRDDDQLGMGGKQRSFSMDLSPSEPPQFGGQLGPGGPTAGIWPLPSPSSISRGVQQIDLSLSQTTPDGKGKKLKCPFCERLYGYETNLRAHIRQRHQGIRVPCPFCTRTFTRNNTVRRHVAREHRALLGGVGVQPFSHLPGPGEGPQPPPPPPPSSSSSTFQSTQHGSGSTSGPSGGGPGSAGTSPSQGSPGTISASITTGKGSQQQGHGGPMSGSPNRPNSTSGGKMMD